MTSNPRDVVSPFFDLKDLEEIVRDHLYPGPVTGSTARLCAALNAKADDILSALQPAVTDAAVEAAAWGWLKALSGYEEGKGEPPTQNERKAIRAALTAALPFMMGPP